MASSDIAVPRFSPSVWVASAALRPIHLLILHPVPLYLLVLTAMLFRPPDLEFYGIDRIAFVLLIVATVMRTVVTRPALHFSGPVTWPLLALFVMGLTGLLVSPYHAEEWSTFVAKWAVPLVLFHLAPLVFDHRRWLMSSTLFDKIIQVAGAILEHFNRERNLAEFAESFLTLVRAPEETSDANLVLQQI